MPGNHGTTNDDLKKIGIAEGIIGLVITFIVVGITYGTLAAGQEANAAAIKEIKVDQKNINEAMTSIQVELATIKANQDSNQKEMQRSINRVLGYLEGERK